MLVESCIPVIPSADLEKKPAFLGGWTGAVDGQSHAAGWPPHRMHGP